MRYEDIHRFFSGGKVHVVNKPQRERPPRGGPVDHSPLPPSNTGLLGFPRIWSYAGTNSNGSPFMSSLGVWDESFITALARFHVTVINTTPFVNLDHPEYMAIVSKLKAQNPRQLFYFYDAFQWRFTHSIQMWLEEYNLSWPHRFYNATPPGGNLTFPFLTPDNSGAVAYWWDTSSLADMDALIAIWDKYVTGHADGYFFDTFTAQPGYGNFSTSVLDFARAGYGSLAACNAASLAGADYFLTKMMQRQPCIINRGGTLATPNATGHKATGEFFENWTTRGAGVNGLPLNYDHGTFDQAMTEAFNFQGSSPIGDGTSLFGCEDAMPGDATTYDAAWCAMLRYTLATACIVGGCSTVTKGNRDGKDCLKWADEYAVQSNGVADTTKTFRGWLGRPTEYGYKDAGGCYVRRFDHGIVVLNGNNTSKTIDLGKPYKRLSGGQDPTTNNGATEQTPTIPAHDGRFYVAI